MKDPRDDRDERRDTRDERDDRPEPVERGSRGGRYHDYPPSEQSNGSKIMKMLLPFVPAILLYFFLSSSILPNYMLKTDNTDNFKNVISDIGTMKSSITQISAIQSDVNTIKGQVPSFAAKNDVQSVSTRMDTFASQYGKPADVSGLQTQIKTVTDKQAQDAKDIATLQDTVKALQTKVNAQPTSTPFNNGGYSGGNSGYNGQYPTNNAINASTYGNLSASIGGMYYSWGQIPLLSFAVQQPSGGGIISANVTSPGTGAYTPNSTLTLSATGGTGSGVVFNASTNAQGAVISVTVLTAGSGYQIGQPLNLQPGTVNNGYAIVTVASVNPITASSSSQTFQLILTNNDANSKTDYNIQLMIGLQYVDTNGNPIATLPSWIVPGTNLTLSSSGYSSIWSYQSIISPNIWVFGNNSTTNPFSMGVMNQGVGTSQYNMYVTVSNSASGVAQNVYLSPVVRILGYTQ